MLQRKLYDGAMCITLPRCFEDISKFRQVPDHQEVFSDAGADRSIIVEINEYQKHVPNEQACVYFFQELGEANQAFSMRILESGTLPNDNVELVDSSFYKSYACGWQQVSKFNETEQKAKFVFIFLVNIRLTNVESDILIMYNLPVDVDANKMTSLMQNPMAHQATHTNVAIANTNNVIENNNFFTNIPGVSHHPFHDAEHATILKHALHSFAIVDWSIFHPPDIEM